jgi:hypothetical protein
MAIGDAEDNEQYSFEEIAPEDQQEDESDLPKDKMGDPSQSVLFNTDWTVSTIVQQIERGNIDMDPKFQRRSAWDVQRKSHLIESLVIGLPIPNIVLAESRGHRGKFIVIDGKQRLSSLFDYMSERSKETFQLKNLSVRPDLNGVDYKILQTNFSSDANFLENAPIRTVVIRNWPSEYFLYVIFDRLNSGSLPLSPQELRRALQPGALLDYIDDFLLKSEIVRSALGLTKPDKRMRDSEIVLRFIAFEKYYPEYDGDFKAFLDAPVRYFNSDWETRKPELDGILKKLETALETSAKVFPPPEIFRKWNGERFEKRMNRALFDSIVRFFTDRNVQQPAIDAKEAIQDKLKALCIQDANFKRSIELTTKTPLAVKTRIGTWGQELAQVLNMQFDEKTFRLHR